MKNKQRGLFSSLRWDVVPKSFSLNDSSVVITGASATGVGLVLEQNRLPVICISRKLSKAEVG